jgi:hypothetical protein
MRRLAQGRSVTAGRSASTPSSGGSSSPKRVYTFASDRHEQAEKALESAFARLNSKNSSDSNNNNNNSNKNSDGQEAMLRAFEQIVQRLCLSPDESMDIFCQAFRRVFQFSSESVALWFPHVFLHMFQSRKSKRMLLRHVQSIVGSDTGSKVAVAERSVRNLFCGLVLVGALEVHDLIEWGKLEGESEGSGTEAGALARERAQLFLAMPMCQSLAQPSQIGEACRTWIISGRLENHYELFPTLSLTHQKQLFSEIYLVADLGNLTSVNIARDQEQNTNTRAAATFAGAWIAAYLKEGSTCFFASRSLTLKSAVVKYDSVFATLFKDKKYPQELLLKHILVAVASVGTDAAATAAAAGQDPLVGVLKGLYNAFALSGSTIIDWHFGAAAVAAPEGLDPDVESDLKKRAKAFIDWLVLQGEKPSETGENMNKNKRRRKKKKKKTKRGFVKADSIIAMQPDIPVSMKRAPIEIARDQRMGRKCWNASGLMENRPETPMFAKWSPIEASRLIDRSVPSFPAAIRTTVHNHRPPRSTQHHMDSEKQQLLHGHYATPQPPKTGKKKKAVVDIAVARPGRSLKAEGARRT